MLVSVIKMPSFNYKYAKNRKKPNFNELAESAIIPKATTSSFYARIFEKFKDLLFNPDQATTVIYCLMPIEIIINILIVFNVNCKYSIKAPVAFKNFK
jgi:hypothetical protein